jgi:hypothetical protein
MRSVSLDCSLIRAPTPGSPLSLVAIMTPRIASGWTSGRGSANSASPVPWPAVTFPEHGVKEVQGVDGSGQTLLCLSSNSSPRWESQCSVRSPCVRTGAPPRRDALTLSGAVRTNRPSGSHEPPCEPLPRPSLPPLPRCPGPFVSGRPLQEWRQWRPHRSPERRRLLAPAPGVRVMSSLFRRGRSWPV